jgi:arsenic resistance protein ArsH
MQRLLFAILSKIVVGRARIIPLKTNIHPSLMLMSTSTITTASDNVSSLNHEPSWKNFALPSSTDDWIQDLELDSAKNFMIEEAKRSPCKILVLYGSLRSESYSKKLAYEFARVLTYLGCDVRVFDPRDLPQHDVENFSHHRKVLELRALSEWSEGQVWVSPEQHGAITGLMKSQLDWIPLSIGSVRPTQGRTLAVAEVSGGSQSFNAVNTLRLLGRWMRMICIPNQSSVPQAWTQFEANPSGRMKNSALRQRVVDVCEELYKFTLLTRGHSEFLVDRYSEREEIREKGRLLTQKEKIEEEAKKK